MGSPSLCSFFPVADREEVGVLGADDAVFGVVVAAGAEMLSPEPWL